LSTWDEIAEREAAIKLFFRDAGIPRRELTVGRTLIHPNIIQIYELIEENGRFGIVMELAPGGNLRAKLAARPMPLHSCLPIWRNILAALAAAHTKNIIHRDVKPENIVFSANGTAKLTDFGHARFLETPASEYTEVGAGTPGYMAPEKESTARSDIYSFGIVAYEMLAGGLPETTALPDGVPWNIRRTLLRCIQRDPSARPQSVAQLIQGLNGPWLLRPVPSFAAMMILMLFAGMGFGTLWWADDAPIAPQSTSRPAQVAVATPAAVEKAPTVAVFFDGATGLGFMQALAKTGQFQVVERAELERALVEMQLGESGVVDMDTAQHAGRIVGAQYLLFGVVQISAHQIHVAARLVETETLLTVKADVVDGDASDDEVELARKLGGRFGS
jgi:TolB-like protein